MSKGIMNNGITTIEETYYFTKGYEQGREDERANILGMVDFKQFKDYHTRSVDMRISFNEMLEPEQVIKIILEQLRIRKNEK